MSFRSTYLGLSTGRSVSLRAGIGTWKRFISRLIGSYQCKSTPIPGHHAPNAIHSGGRSCCFTATSPQLRLHLATNSNDKLIYERLPPSNYILFRPIIIISSRQRHSAVHRTDRSSTFAMSSLLALEMFAASHNVVGIVCGCAANTVPGFPVGPHIYRCRRGGLSRAHSVGRPPCTARQCVTTRHTPQAIRLQGSDDLLLLGNISNPQKIFLSRY